MLTAQQARELAMNVKTLPLEEIMKWIEVRAKEGKRSTYFDINEISSKDIESLAVNGYVVSFLTESIKVEW